MKYTSAMLRVVMAIQQQGITDPSPNTVAQVANIEGEQLTSQQIIYISDNV